MMSPRERIFASIRGGSSDRKPVFVWPNTDERSDVICVDVSQIGDAVDEDSNRAVLAIVDNPFIAAQSAGENLTAIARKDAEQGQARIEEYVADVAANLERAIGYGADGVLYRMGGVDPSENTPMEFGGLYLEHDRRLLESVYAAPFNMLLVAGPPDYLDFLEDLPAHALGWDPDDLRWSYPATRKIWPNAIAAEAPEADIFFTHSYDRVASWLTEQNYV